MKKILTLVLALVLVFAIAAPALAITGEVPSEEDLTAVAPVQLAVELFTAAPESSSFGGFKLSQVAANKAYIVNEIAFYGVALNFVKPDADEEEIAMNTTDYIGAKLTLESDAIALNDGKIKAYVFDDDDNKVKLADATKYVMEDNTWQVPNVAGETWKSGNTVYFFGQGVVEDKGVLTAELARTNKVGDVEHPLVINDADGEEVCSVWSVNAGFVVNVPGDGSVFFTVDGDKEVTKISAKLAQAVVAENEEEYAAGTDLTLWQEVTFKKVVSGGGEVVESIGAYKGKDLAAAKALYEFVMEFFGFDYDAEGTLEAKHFEKKATGLYLKDEVAVQLYTAAIVVPGGVNPPKTGDAATVVGFVMIVLAMVACGVVVSRKVRA